MSFRIERLWAFVGQAPADDEGLIAERRLGVWLPFVAADDRRLEQLKARAALIPVPSGTRVTLVRFDVRTDVETLRSGT